MTNKNNSQKSYPVIKDGYVQITVAEYDELLALSKLNEAENNFNNQNFTTCKKEKEISDHLEALMK